MNRTRLEYESETSGVNIRKREFVKILEKDWRENVTPDKGIEIKIVSKKVPVSKEKHLMIEAQEAGIVAAMYYNMEGISHVKGSGMIGIKKPGNNAVGNMSYNTANFTKLMKGNYATGNKDGLWFHSNQLIKSPYKQEEFIKNHLENGYITVEVNSEISVNGEVVEDREMKMKKAVVSDINNFCRDESSSDFLVICEGEKIPCHRIILCSRCPVIADGLAANMSEETSNRWTVTNSNPKAVKDMLHFIYSGEIRGLTERPTELLHLASFYRLPVLEMASKEELVRRLTAENAVETLVELDKYAPNDGEVKEKVMAFIKMNARQVVEGEDWNVFVKNYIYLVTDIVKAMAN